MRRPLLSHLRRAGAAHQFHQFGHFRHAADIRSLDCQRAHRQRRQRHREIAAIESDDDVFSAFDQTIETEARALRGADQVNDRPGAASRKIDDLLRGIGGTAVDHMRRAGFFRGFTLGRVDVDNDGRVPAHLLMQSKTHQAKAAGANNHSRLGSQGRHFFQRAESRHARTGKRRGALGWQIADFKEIPRVRHDHVIGIAAVGEHPEALHRATEILLVAPTGVAGAATDPRMCEHARTDPNVFRIRPCRNDLADILVPERDGQRHAAVRETEPLAATEIEPAVGEMQIAVADSRCKHFKQNLRAFWLRRWLLVALQRLATNADLKHAHGSIPL